MVGKCSVRVKPGGLGDGSPPVGSRGKAPVGGLGDEVPQKLELFCEISVQILVSDEKNALRSGPGLLDKSNK